LHAWPCRRMGPPHPVDGVWLRSAKVADVGRRANARSAQRGKPVDRPGHWQSRDPPAIRRGSSARRDRRATLPRHKFSRFFLFSKSLAFQKARRVKGSPCRLHTAHILMIWPGGAGRQAQPNYLFG
jgi:hypothetical protein